MKNIMLTSTMRHLFLTMIVIFITTLFTKAQAIRMVIKEERASCTGVAPQTCFQVKYTNSKNWELFYSAIEGFKYQEGYRYVLLVNRTKRANVPADASAYIYKLKKVLKKQKMKTNDVWSFITRHSWNLIQINGRNVAQTSAFLTFDQDKSRFNGNAGCNGIFGGYKLTADSISFLQVASTMMACPDENVSKLEHEFTTLLGEHTFKFDVADQTLNLYQGNNLVLMFGMAPLKKPNQL